MALEGALRISVDRDVHGLPHAHKVELRLLEIGGHPHLARHEHHQGLPRLRIGPLGAGDLRGNTIDGCFDDGAREIGLCQGRLRLRRVHLALRHFLLRSQHRNLLLGGGLSGDSGVECSLFLRLIRLRLLCCLHGADAALHQVLRAQILLLGECERRARLRHFPLRLFDPRLLRIDLGGEIGDRRLGFLDLSFCLVDCRPIIAVVDAEQHMSFVDSLVVRYGEIDNGPGDLRANRYGPCVYEGVIGRFVLACIKPPVQSRRADPDNGQRHGECRVGMIANPCCRT